MDQTWFLHRVGFPNQVHRLSGLNLKPRDVIMVGSGSRMDIICPSPFVSRSHCQFHLEKNGWHVTDLMSSQGVFVNGKGIPWLKPTLLKPGDLIGLGTDDPSLSSNIFTFQLMCEERKKTPHHGVSNATDAGQSRSSRGFEFVDAGTNQQEDPSLGIANRPVMEAECAAPDPRLPKLMRLGHAIKVEKQGESSQRQSSRADPLVARSIQPSPVKQENKEVRHVNLNRKWELIPIDITIPSRPSRVSESRPQQSRPHHHAGVAANEDQRDPLAF